VSRFLTAPSAQGRLFGAIKVKPNYQYEKLINNTQTAVSKDPLSLLPSVDCEMSFNCEAD